MLHRLKLARTVLGLTQQGFGAYLGLSQANKTDLESRRVKIALLHLATFAKYRRINPGWLTNGESDIFFEKIENGILNSPVENVSVDLLYLIFETVEEYLSETELSLPAKLKAKMLFLIYNEYKYASKVTKQGIIKYIKFTEQLYFNE